MNATTFKFDYQDCVALCGMLHDWIGVHTDPHKTYLFSGRLRGILSRHGWTSLAELLGTLRSPASLLLRHEVIEAMTTHETLFFRDTHPFDAIASTLIPGWLRDQTARRIRVHCVACSTGQEPYSLWMRLSECLSSEQLSRIDLQASDVSPKTIETARRGRYHIHEINRGLSAHRRDTFFRPVEKNSDPQSRSARAIQSGPQQYELLPSVRSRVQFEVRNLANWNIAAAAPKLDICFCRNVLIYFDDAMQHSILQRLADAIRPGGYLVIGGSEMLRHARDRFVREIIDGSTMYRRTDVDRT